MIELTREFRFFLPADTAATERGNSWSGRFASWRISPYLTLRATVRGPIAQPAGYLCDIRSLDTRMARIIESLAADTSSGRRFDDLLQSALATWQEAIDTPWTLMRLELCISPQFSLALNDEDWSMLSITRQYEFSASHRLHCTDWTDAENRATFGKCNNPAGHGHNYVLEVTVEQPSRIAPGARPSLDQLDDVVQQQVISRLDHRNLNVDVPEFAQLNPSVEHIAQIIWSWLTGPIEGCRLTRIRLYETPKTWVEITPD